jgi:DNA-binding NarL/FixJ family response regulator
MTWISRYRRPALFAGAATTFALLLGMEILKEEDLGAVEILTEAVTLALIVGCSVCAALFSARLTEQEAESSDIRGEIARIKARDAQWRTDLASHFQELGAAIQSQFVDWGFTRAEQDVGLLLLKGFSHKEIARLRNTSEATIRQQATALYQKAGLSGRAALSAYFLEELLLPPEPAPRPRSTGLARPQ